MCYELTDFSGPFKDVMPEYIMYMRGLGYDYGRASVYRLREIDIFFKQRGFERAEVTEEMYELWAERRNSESAINQYKRTLALISFSRHLALKGFANIYVGDPPRKSVRSDFIPYIFSKPEISRLMSVFRLWIDAKPADYEVAAVAVMVTLFYGCGLRKSEAQKLQIRDVSLTAGTIRVMDSKNHTSRLVVASASVIRQLSAYCDRFRAFGVPDDFLFPNDKGNPFNDGKLYVRYKRALKKAGIQPRESGYLPRLHDLRHTFCVHTLEAMAAKGFDLYVSLPLLVAYLGHKCITETEYYLRLVEQNFSSVTDANRKYAPGLFPRVEDLR